MHVSHEIIGELCSNRLGEGVYYRDCYVAPFRYVGSSRDLVSLPTA